MVAVSTEPSSLDPHNVNMVTAFMIGQHVVDRLFVSDAEYNITPSLAETYTWLDDTTLQVKIRPLFRPPADPPAGRWPLPPAPRRGGPTAPPRWPWGKGRSSG